jgi:hypothetical protein
VRNRELGDFPTGPIILAAAKNTVNSKIVLNMRYKLFQALERLVQLNRLTVIIVLDKTSMNVSIEKIQFQPNKKTENNENQPSNADFLMGESVFVLASISAVTDHV